MKPMLGRFNISKKISGGYALAIGIAVLGTSTGLFVSNYYQQQAKAQMLSAQRDSRLLSSLQVAILGVRSHQQEIISLTSQPQELKAEYLQLVEEVTTVKTLLASIKSSPRTQTTQALEPLLPVYESTVKEYDSSLKIIIKQVDPLILGPNQKLAEAKQLLQNLISSSIALKLNYLSYRLTNFIKTADQQQDSANKALDSAEQLRNQILAVSMLLSIALAAILAIYTSRVIARPLEAVTQVALRVTKESNFELEAPVTTKDEVGTLATSLNQLIKWVSNYTHQLEQARETLEKRVEERTEEIFHKNQELELAKNQLTQALQNLQHTQAQLIQTEKMSSLGQMVAGVAHEINNPVNFIYGNITHIEEYIQELLGLTNLYQQTYPNTSLEIQDFAEAIDFDFMKEDLPRILSSMRIGAERIRQIVMSLRNFSRLDEAEVKFTNIHEGIDNTLLILNHRLKRKVEVIKQYDNLPLIECYPAQLNQVFMNIINNAIDAVIEQDSLSSKQIVIRTETTGYNQIQVRIQDNGVGIQPEIQSKLFDPFFTTKSIGQGTGLGLYISYQIIEKHHGQIEVSSEPGKGTEFKIILPLQLSPQKIVCGC